jgi:hypothetical protein
MFSLAELSAPADVIGRIRRGGRFCCFSTGWAFCQPLFSQEQLVCPYKYKTTYWLLVLNATNQGRFSSFFNNFNFAKLAKDLLKMKLFTANQNTFLSFSQSEFQSIHVYAFKVCSRNVHS